MELSLSHATGPTEPPLRDITLGQLLAWAAETTPERLALIEARPDPAARRQWTNTVTQQAKTIFANFADAMGDDADSLRRSETGKRPEPY